jgi:hypothetical protein
MGYVFRVDFFYYKLPNISISQKRPSSYSKILVYPDPVGLKSNPKGLISLGLVSPVS